MIKLAIMSHDALFAYWFFLPAGIANLTPILAARAPLLSHWNQPIDAKRSLWGRRILGDNKTWRGIFSGVIVGSILFWIQVALYLHTNWAKSVSQPIDYSDMSLLVLGPLLSLGALTGDAVKSFFKRRLGLAAGKTWLLFDQLDYVIGGLLLSALVVRLSLRQYALIVITWFVIHVVSSYIGYLTKHKDQPI